MSSCTRSCLEVESNFNFLKRHPLMMMEFAKRIERCLQEHDKHDADDKDDDGDDDDDNDELCTTYLTTSSYRII